MTLYVADTPVRTNPLSTVVGGLVFWLALTFLAATFGAQFEPGTWYANLNKPDWTPPGWLFPPVWTALYSCMGLAAWLVWRKAGWHTGRVPLSIYLVHLVVNAAWSWVFFGEHHIGLAVLNILVLLALILLLIRLFWIKNRLAGILLVPYATWVGFASVLNAKIFLMNA